LFVVGRVVYFRSYVREPGSRSVGFGLTILPNMVLLAGSIIGALLHVIRNGWSA
jgi:hypothetical protein